MATAYEFKDAWLGAGDELVIFPEDVLRERSIPEAAVLFLTGVGLPGEAAPLLTFGPSHSGQWATEAHLPGGFQQIGSDGSGNPLVIRPDGVVVVLDHERDWSSTYVSADVERLASALLACRDLIAALNAVEDRGGGTEDPQWQRASEQFCSTLRADDPEALELPAFWAQEFRNISGLLGNQV